MKTKITPKQTQWRSPEDLPDDECTVLIRLESDEWPVVLGYHSGDEWRDNLTDDIATDIVLGWMHLHEAAANLDQTQQPNEMSEHCEDCAPEFTDCWNRSKCVKRPISPSSNSME